MTPHDDTADMYEPPAPDKVYRHHRQQLSAMLDGELPPDQGRFMLRRLEHDRDLADCWERWQVLGDVMRGRGEVLLPGDFAQRVQAAIAADAAVDAVAAPMAAAGGGVAPSRWLRWGGGAALAASVAAIALMVGRPAVQDPATEVPSQVASRDAAPAAPVRPPVVDEAPSTAFAGGATALAVVAAAADSPRRGGERRARAANERAVARVTARRTPAAPAASVEVAPVLVASIVDGPAAPQVRDPFAATGLPAARPWPRAILPELSAPSGVNASLSTSAAFHPFQPHVVVPPRQAATDAPPPSAEATTP